MDPTGGESPRSITFFIDPLPLFAPTIPSTSSSLFQSSISSSSCSCLALAPTCLFGLFTYVNNILDDFMTAGLLPLLLLLLPLLLVWMAFMIASYLLISCCIIDTELLDCTLLLLLAVFAPATLFTFPVSITVLAVLLDFNGNCNECCFSNTIDSVVILIPTGSLIPSS